MICKPKVVGLLLSFDKGINFSEQLSGLLRMLQFTQGERLSSDQDVVLDHFPGKLVAVGLDETL